MLAHRKKASLPFPTFELSDMWSDSEVSFAQVGSNGTMLRFSASAFALFPDPVAQWIIAHELAHVYQKAIGRLPDGNNEAENEDDANRITESWGFDKRPRVILGVLMQSMSFEEAIELLAELVQS